MASWPVYLEHTDTRKDGDIVAGKGFCLPFRPFIGLRLLMDGEMVARLHHVEWDVDDEQFNAFSGNGLESECPCKPEDQCCMVTQSSIDYYLDRGWEVYTTRLNDWQPREPGQFDAAQMESVQEQEFRLTKKD